MTQTPPIPVFTRYGETTPFPDVVHSETFLARAPDHAWSISAHRHANMAQLFAITTGFARARVDGRDMSLGDGTYLFVPTHCVHEFDFEPFTDGRVFSFPQSIVNTIGPASPQLSAAVSRPSLGPLGPLADLATALTHVLDGTQMFRQQIAVGLAHSVLGIVAGMATTGDDAPASDRLAALNALIALHQSKGWGAAQYAAALSVTTGHLSRVCRNATGMGASAYIERHIMTEACRLLAFTRLPVTQIGYRLGFADPSYFSKRFRSVRGQTPSGYRAQFTR